MPISSRAMNPNKPALGLSDYATNYYEHSRDATTCDLAGPPSAKTGQLKPPEEVHVSVGVKTVHSLTSTALKAAINASPFTDQLTASSPLVVADAKITSMIFDGLPALNRPAAVFAMNKLVTGNEGPTIDKPTAPDLLVERVAEITLVLTKDQRVSNNYVTSAVPPPSALEPLSGSHKRLEPRYKQSPSRSLAHTSKATTLKSPATQADSLTKLRSLSLAQSDSTLVLPSTGTINLWVQAPYDPQDNPRCSSSYKPATTSPGYQHNCSPWQDQAHMRRTPEHMLKTIANLN
ncbi:hypothetical protein RSOLAG1IB_10850 [Rhizoctonia solani AG-1 IB]|uniref:Uncharacterized protein n=1 Tax=Thanatephorus cucumeris (strain AG1-IB / isolate 7/3/14) TaxID=1108050 RepID=A0A0B7G366_THACB|nr:hypothetical protein RSOLAG1IB_10850 [Rhizoctonia solani AG-1 IB]